MAPTQPRFQAAVLILCLKSCILVLLQYGKVQATPYRMASEWALKPSKLAHATKWLA